MIKKFSKWIITIAISLFSIGCFGSPVQTKTQKIIAENGIQSYEIVVIKIDSLGIEEEGYVIMHAEFDKQGYLLKGVTTDSVGQITKITKREYKDNQIIECDFDNKNVLTSTSTHYISEEGKDTLVIYTKDDNQLICKTVKKYDSIGLKEEEIYSQYDSKPFSYTKRLSNDKTKQVFETRHIDGTLVYKTTRYYDKKGREIELLFEPFNIVREAVFTHYKTIYLENGLIDNLFCYNEKGNLIMRRVFRYKKFDN